MNQPLCCLLCTLRLAVYFSLYIFEFVICNGLSSSLLLYDFRVIIRYASANKVTVKCSPKIKKTLIDSTNVSI